MYEIFANLLKEKNITPYKVAKETGIATATLSDWKNGRSKPKQDKLIKIADYFGVSLDYLIGKTEIRSPIISEIANAWGETPEAVNEVAGDSIAKIEKSNDEFSALINERVNQIRDLYYREGFKDGEKSAQKEPATTEGDGLDAEILERINRLDKSRKEDAIKYLDFLISQGKQ